MGARIHHRQLGADARRAGRRGQRAARCCSAARAECRHPGESEDAAPNVPQAAHALVCAGARAGAAGRRAHAEPVCRGADARRVGARGRRGEGTDLCHHARRAARRGARREPQWTRGWRRSAMGCEAPARARARTRARARAAWWRRWGEAASASAKALCRTSYLDLVINSSLYDTSLTVPRALRLTP